MHCIAASNRFATVYQIWVHKNRTLLRKKTPELTEEQTFRKVFKIIYFRIKQTRGDELVKEKRTAFIIIVIY